MSFVQSFEILRRLLQSSLYEKFKATLNAQLFSADLNAYIEVHGHVDVDDVAILQSEIGGMSGACSYSKTNAEETQ
jgi:hypothetical protein